MVCAEVNGNLKWGPNQEQAESRDLWFLSIITSITTVVVFFAAANLIMGRYGMPLGYDSYAGYIPQIERVLAIGPVQFASSQHYIEVLYPIIGSFAVRLGATVYQFEVYAPAIMSIGTVGATAYLAREFKDSRVGILSVAFAAGWFAIYRMGADYHGQLLAFPFLLAATAILVRINKTRHMMRDFALFGVLLVLATLAHVETTGVFIAVWVLTFAAFGLRKGKGMKRLLLIVGVSLIIAVPVLYEYPLSGITSTVLPYPELPTFWLEVLGPEVALVALGLWVCANDVRKGESDLLTGLVLGWAVLSFILLSGWYVFHVINLDISDRAFLMTPVPLLSSKATVWLGGRGNLFVRYQNLLVLLILIIPAITAPAIFLYLVPERFRYYAPYFP